MATEGSMMNVQDYAAMREIENGHNKHAGAIAAIWAIVAVIVIAFFVYIFQKNCNEKVQFATSIARLDGRLDCVEPQVQKNAKNVYKINGVLASTVQGVKDMDDNMYQMNKTLYWDDSRRSRRRDCDECGNRTFNQRSTYNLASQEVTVDERCTN